MIMPLQLSSSYKLGSRLFSCLGFPRGNRMLALSLNLSVPCFPSAGLESCLIPDCISRFRAKRQACSVNLIPYCQTTLALLGDSRISILSTDESCKCR